MYVIRFSAFRLVEYTNPGLFQVQIGKWMEIREAENSYLLGQLPWIVARSQGGRAVPERLFALKDGDNVVAAGILFNGGCFGHTWASHDMLDAIVDGLIKAKCAVTSMFGPAHVSWLLAEQFAQRTHQQFDLGRAERVYQLARLKFMPPETGRLEQATERDIPMLGPWVEGFIEEAEFELQAGQHEATLREMVQKQVLYLWKAPEAVSMAAWMVPTARGGSINFVYTPPHLRRRGYARAVVAALAKRVLSSGVAYCFIMTDTVDDRTNKLYQSVGARTVCELLRCPIKPAAPVRAATPASTTNALSRNGFLHAGAARG